MRKTLGLTLLLVGASVLAWANPAPEIDPGNGASAVALVAGMLLVVRARRKQ